MLCYALIVSLTHTSISEAFGEFNLGATVAQSGLQASGKLNKGHDMNVMVIIKLLGCSMCFKLYQYQACRLQMQSTPT